MFKGSFDDDEQKLLIDGLANLLAVTQRAAKAQTEPDFAPIYARKIARVMELRNKVVSGGVK